MALGKPGPASTITKQAGSWPCSDIARGGFRKCGTTAPCGRARRLLRIEKPHQLTPDGPVLGHTTVDENERTHVAMYCALHRAGLDWTIRILSTEIACARAVPADRCCVLRTGESRADGRLGDPRTQYRMGGEHNCFLVCLAFSGQWDQGRMAGLAAALH